MTEPLTDEAVVRLREWVTRTARDWDRVVVPIDDMLALLDEREALRAEIQAVRATFMAQHVRDLEQQNARLLMAAQALVDAVLPERLTEPDLALLWHTASEAAALREAMRAEDMTPPDGPAVITPEKILRLLKERQAWRGALERIAASAEGHRAAGWAWAALDAS